MASPTPTHTLWTFISYVSREIYSLGIERKGWERAKQQKDVSRLSAIALPSVVLWRDFDDEYELRAAIQNTEPKRETYTPTGTVSDAEAALSVGVRNRIESKDVTAEALIEREYDLDPDDYDDVEELRAAIVAKGVYEADEPNAPSRSSVFSDPNDRL